MRVPYNYLARQFNVIEVDHILAALRAHAITGDFTLGAPVLEFERRFAAMVGVRHAIGVNSGTDALILALKALRIGPGDEVITQVNTFYATVGAIMAVGATPRFVDVGSDFGIEVGDIPMQMTPRTRAILPVCWLGLPPDLPAVLELARACGVEVIEDACPGVDAAYEGKAAGSFGTLGAFSFHPLKQLNVWGDGGTVVTDDDDLATWIRLYRNHGMSGRDTIPIWGVNSRFQSFQAVVALQGLDRVHGWVNRRIEVAERLDQGLGAIEGITVPPRHSNRRHAYQVYTVTAANRDGLRAFLADHGVETKIHYPVPLHLQPAAINLGYKAGDFPVAERQAKTMVSLPCNQYLGDEEVDFMIERIRVFYRA